MCLNFCRTPKKAQEAKEDILRETMAPESNIIIIKLDLCDFDSVNEFVRQFRALKLPLHGLVNNAGVMSDHRIPTVVREMQHQLSFPSLCRFMCYYTIILRTIL